MVIVKEDHGLLVLVSMILDTFAVRYRSLNLTERLRQIYGHIQPQRHHQAGLLGPFP